MKPFDLLDFVLPREEAEIEKKLALQLWASPGGKSKLAKVILPFFPEHKIYVEPFAGGATCFYLKERSEVEVLNDKNESLALAFKFVRGHTRDDITKLRKLDWKVTRENYDKTRRSNVKELSPVKIFHRVAFLSYASFFAQMGKHFNKTRLNNQMDIDAIVRSLAKCKSRLKNVKIYGKDYGEIIDKFDSRDTFFFFDPPYVKTAQRVGETEFNHDEFWKRLNALKGRFLVTYDKEVTGDTYRVKEIRHLRRHKDGSLKRGLTYLIMNY